ncbi:hypothetical protein EXIGLDRAFT_744599 [Exidia glandulosa HHB12029]|uniref:Transmembrane protein n=1 Tax=Exidia glandulosa HHB12029 TaxID=1314781 RepID=A0A165PNQ7_EXIGL|nr:hypothetical protein EXIGLDRAFT_744599 [Exidia glandulosa HHB12029]
MNGAPPVKFCSHSHNRTAAASCLYSVRSPSQKPTRVFHLFFLGLGAPLFSCPPPSASSSGNLTGPREFRPYCLWELSLLLFSLSRSLVGPVFLVARCCTVPMAPPQSLASNASRDGPSRLFAGVVERPIARRSSRSGSTPGSARRARRELDAHVARDAGATTLSASMASTSLIDSDVMATPAADGPRHPSGGALDTSPLGGRAGIIAFLTVGGILVLALFWFFYARRAVGTLLQRLRNPNQPHEKDAGSVGVASNSSSGTDTTCASVELAEIPAKRTSRLHTAASSSSFAPLIPQGKPKDKQSKTFASVKSRPLFKITTPKAQARGVGPAIEVAEYDEKDDSLGGLKTDTLDSATNTPQQPETASFLKRLFV